MIHTFAFKHNLYKWINYQLSFQNLSYASKWDPSHALIYCLTLKNVRCRTCYTPLSQKMDNPYEIMTDVDLKQSRCNTHAMVWFSNIAETMQHSVTLFQGSSWGYKSTSFFLSVLQGASTMKAQAQMFKNQWTAMKFNVYIHRRVVIST